MTSTLGRSATPTERTYLSIREVLELLIGDFPDVTISKIRFLEARGLIHPERTPSGYRKFYREDVDRLRWILRQQRENYLPLNVIKVRLDGGEAASESLAEAPSLFDDAPYEPPPSPELNHEPFPPLIAEKPATVFRGHPAEGVAAPRHLGIHREATQAWPVTAAVDTTPRAVLPTPSTPLEASSAPLSTLVAPAPSAPAVASAPPVEPMPGAAPAVAESAPEVPAPRSRASTTRRTTRNAQKDGFTAAELAIVIGSEPQFVNEIANYGLISCKEVAGELCYNEEARHLAQVAFDFSKYGIEPRHLKSLLHAANREAELFSQVVVPLLRQRNPEAREKAQADLAALVSLGAAFKSTLIQAELRNLTGG